MCLKRHVRRTNENNSSTRRHADYLRHSSFFEFLCVHVVIIWISLGQSVILAPLHCCPNTMLGGTTQRGNSWVCNHQQLRALTVTWQKRAQRQTHVYIKDPSNPAPIAGDIDGLHFSIKTKFGFPQFKKIMPLPSQYILSEREQQKTVRNTMTPIKIKPQSIK